MEFLIQSAFVQTVIDRLEIPLEISSGFCCQKNSLPVVRNEMVKQRVIEIDTDFYYMISNPSERDFLYTFSLIQIRTQQETGIRLIAACQYINDIAFLRFVKNKRTGKFQRLLRDFRHGTQHGIETAMKYGDAKCTVGNLLPVAKFRDVDSNRKISLFR